MKKNISTLLVLVALLFVNAANIFAQEAARKGENVIMTGFNIKDPVINAMIEADKAHRDSIHAQNPKDLGLGHLIIPRALNKIPLSTFPDKALWVCKQLHDRGFQVYIIGGSVRDMMLNAKVDDADLVTNATLSQQREIFGKDLRTHVAGTDTFAIVIVGEDAVDLASLQHCPAVYIDRGLVKGISKEDVSFLTDTYERDLPFNAIYYDPYSGDIIDYHGGLQDIRDNTIHTSVDPDALYMSDPAGTLLRTLRFQAKFDSKLAPELEEAIKKNARTYEKQTTPNVLYANATKMFMGGYGMKCYRSLLKYNIFDLVFPCASILKNKKAYTAYLEKKIAELDERAKNTEISKGEAFAAITYPVYKQLRKKMDSAAAMKKIVELQAPVMELWDSRRVQPCYEQMYAAGE